MTSTIYTHVKPTGNRLVGLLIERIASLYMCDLYIFSSPYLISKNFQSGPKRSNSQDQSLNSVVST